MRTRPIPSAPAVILSLALVALPGLSAPAAAAGDHPSARSGTAAVRALETAEATLAGRGQRDATLALRDLVLRRDQLSGADAERARRVLSRPTDPGDDDQYPSGANVKSACGTYVCLHWVEKGDDAATASYAAETLATINDVHETYVDAGYRAPLADDGIGGNDKPDVYLSNIGDDGLYGYCTSDDPADSYDIWAYCVLDNDYSPDEFGTNTPIENMQVTAAHEYFHAVQFAYDAGEDGWFMEATATWAEDEVFDDVDDNLNYLGYSPLAMPEVSLDEFVDLNQYGDWIFFRYLTERLTETEGTMPRLVLDFWERADSTHGEDEDYYSLQAIKAVLAGEGWSLKGAFASFSADNNHPGTTYEEGAENDYPLPPYAFSNVTLSPSKTSSAWRSTVVDHLASATGAFLPAASMSGAWNLKVKVDMAARKRGSVAVVTSYDTAGETTSATIPLNRDGDGSLTVPFSHDDVLGVEVTLVNASDRLSCWTSNASPFACYGTPKDDNLRQRLSATATRG